ncbi:MAG TPA: LysM peptidoglycan-binding domain-containing protein [Gemmatimonadaceae bacterium]|nr:LysM peptidoglycan-binding domain-containing protein [Gemmatimonadaceae bacterium]
MKESEGLYRWFRFIKKAVIGLVVVLGGIMIFGYAVFMRRVDARGAWEAASRELNGGMLHYGEHVERYAKAFQRRPTDYYRAANGLLVATNDRVVFIGVAPTDKLQNEDAPATILQYEFPNDTMLTIKQMRLYLLTAHGVRISHGAGTTQEFAASPGDEASLDSLLDHVNRKLDQQRVEAIRERRIRAAVAKLIDEPIYYTVRRGDAISSIAARFDTTPDIIRKLNNLPGDKVRIGEVLLVKAKGPRPKLPPPPPPRARRNTAPPGPKI